MTTPAGDTVRLRRLNLVDEGDDVLVGDPETGTVVSLPAVGGVVLRALQRGATLAQTAREAEAFAGEPVDVPDFVEALRKLGFVADGADGERLPAATAPIQGRRWLYGLRPELARPLFGRVAWTVYGGSAVFNLGALAAAPRQLWPRPAEDAFLFADLGLSVLLLLPLALGMTALHECWHWLAARARGVPARFGVDRRMVFLVFETDLSRLWSLPRRQRYGPLLAGLALDSVILSVVLALRLAGSAGWWHPPPLAASVLAVVGLVLIVRMLWQCMVFLRTDLYAVLVTATGCRNLWRVKTLLLRRAFGRLTAAQASELSTADPADLRVGRWFRWLWLAGLAVVAGYVVVFLVPVMVTVAEWAGAGLALGPAAWQFWYRAGCAAVLFAPLVMVAVLAGTELARRVAAGRRA